MMLTRLIRISLLFLAGTATAQTPDGFQPVAKTSLNLSFGSNGIETPGKRVERSETSQPPSVSASSLGPSNKGVLFMIDLDVNRNNTRVPLLHWLAPNVTFQSGTSGILKIPQPPPGAPYQQPSPPAGDIPHRYTFLLFSQPAGFRIPGTFDSINPPDSGAARVGFNIQAFIVDAKLDAPLAGNFITVQNTTSSTGSTSGSAGASASGASASQTSSGTGPSSPAVAGGSPSVAAGGGLWRNAIAIALIAFGAAVSM